MEISKEEKIVDMVGELYRSDPDSALMLASSIFVSVVESYTELSGNDPNKKITIDSENNNRKIILEEIKEQFK